MKRYGMALVGVVLTAVTGIFFVATRPASRPPASPLIAHTVFSLGEKAPAIRPLPSSAAKAELVGTPSTPEGEPEPVPALIPDPAAAAARLGKLVATADPAVLPELAGYLEHPLREVREKAVNALLLLGESAAAPFLRKAAERAQSRQEGDEARAMREAADFLASAPPDSPRAPNKNLSSQDVVRKRPETEAKLEGRERPAERSPATQAK